LLIEPDWRIRKLCRVNLEAVGLRVVEAVDGLHGLRLQREVGADLILLSLGAPEQELLGLLPALRSTGTERQTPVILISEEPPGRLLDGLDRPIGHLRKPFSAPALVSAVRKALDGRTSEETPD